ncbi:uncharacterized protein MELLADRAFT_85877 [Melampsora larici-populina 98AG31]|uniref:Uncharacterized protein n=1 Tax=Melampsora larici-populina (strain 98AG31 / pathotype 3-4-7) TaxID=747676 RepID=F4SDG6_MELLP|nr:uncharacterized protein MELLADRAFT_85877 [Melampsora larici-populina 98AG31]EGF97310.1 hypothetical protein MELLADRAFT_85877 [Melampsora larici-populina 98AG31]
MRARGFWREGHYWCKVVRTVGGLTGVWYNNDLENDGMARLVSRDLETIGGASPSTSWVMYSRAPTEEETVIFKRADEKINKSIGKKGVVDRPFSQSKNDADEDEVLSDQDGHWEEDQGLPEDFDMLDNHDVKPLFLSDLQAEDEPTESKPQVQLQLPTSTKGTKSKKPKKVKVAEKKEYIYVDSDQTGEVEQEEEPTQSNPKVQLPTSTKKTKSKQPKKVKVAEKECIHIDSDQTGEVGRAALRKPSKNEGGYNPKDIHIQDIGKVVTMPKKSEAKRGERENFQSLSMLINTSLLINIFFWLLVARSNNDKPKWKGWVIMDQEEEEVNGNKGVEEAEDGDEEVNDNSRRSKRIKLKRS